MTDDIDPWQYARADETDTRRKFLQRRRMQARLDGNTPMVDKIDFILNNSKNDWLDNPWQYAHRPKGFTNKRDFLEYLRNKAIQEDAHDLLHNIDKMIREYDAMQEPEE